MSEYYGITTPTDDFLAHYGTPGMKWGVRKAIANRMYSNVYKNAQKKLANKEKAGKALSPVTSKSELKKQALSASEDLVLARKRRDKSLLGRHGFGKTARDYTKARIKAKEATSAYYDSLSKKEFEKLRRNHIG